MNTIQDMIKAIKELQRQVAELKTQTNGVASQPEPVIDTTVRRGRPRKAETSNETE